jgi:hypothetical protein
MSTTLAHIHGMSDALSDVGEGSATASTSRKTKDQLARSVISDQIVFLGETNMGDVGTNIFTHRNSRGEIDFLIIDSWYFFDSTEIDSM